MSEIDYLPNVDKLETDEEFEKTIKNLCELSSPTEIQEFIETVKPGWLLYKLDRYSADYKFLDDNWTKICEMNKMSPQKIVLVSNIVFDIQHRLENVIAEFLTRKGYVVRRITEFIPCSNCERAIPCKEVWEKMVENNLPVPSTWASTCTGCLP
jgi:hypothetical protein